MIEISFFGTNSQYYAAAEASCKTTITFVVENRAIPCHLASLSGGLYLI